jgi:hypothetical protein
VLELPTSAIAEIDRYPDRDQRYIYEHLKHACSLPSPFPLPAVVVDVVDGRCVVSAGHKYLRIARDLGRPRIRCVVSKSLPEDRILELVPGSSRVAADILRTEQNVTVVPDYHVYFFETPLSTAEQSQFREDIVGFFERLQTPLLRDKAQRILHYAFPFEGRCAEFQALIPVGDGSWLGAYLEAGRKFSRDVKRIVSFQGAHFN